MNNAEKHVNTFRANYDLINSVRKVLLPAMTEVSKAGCIVQVVTLRSSGPSIRIKHDEAARDLPKIVKRVHNGKTFGETTIGECQVFYEITEEDHK